MKISEKTFSADQKRVDELSRKVLLLLADNDATDGEIIVALAKSSALGVFFAAQKNKSSITGRLLCNIHESSCRYVWRSRRGTRH
ncbi:hypothetical protein [Prevotella sp. DNF00663]|uniref:hypothetical protein n=1 Tax=Prevotella sp. DNF00663 TaxID=1384078 RepID=UPI0007834135|nr:hypothetical protein [Prevotella sp. DNF00663]